MGFVDFVTHRHTLILAYGLLVLLMIVGFIRVESLANRIEDEALTRSAATCAAVNEQANALRTFTYLLRNLAAEGGETEEEAMARDRFVEDVESFTEAQACPEVGDRTPSDN